MALTETDHRGGRAPFVWLHVGFALTGVSTTLLGCILPTLNNLWHLGDRRAGLLFAAQFTGSASGALLVRNNFFRSLVNGYLLLIVSAISVAFFTGFAEVLLFLAFGLGIGLTMTSTSLLIGTRFSANRGSALSVLNAVWGLGAVLTPAAVSLWIGRWKPTSLFLVLAFGLTVVLVSIGMHPTLSAPSTRRAIESAPENGRLKIISIFAVLSFLYVGTEVSVSGWMMSYVHRLTASSRSWAPMATSCFWVALLCGRTLVPVLERWLSEARLLTTSLIIALISVLLLIASHIPLAIVFSATCAGFALAPIFPLCLARALEQMHDSPESKWIFAISGFGGAILPWVTGEFSAHTGSLRLGLLVPAFALGVMILLDRLSNSGTPASQDVRGAIAQA